MFQPINQEHVQKTAQVVLSYLDDENNSTPNHMVEGIASGKSLFRAILSGDLVICQNIQTPEVPDEVKKAVSKKKTAKKAA